jgi:LPXTG-motif cell wall-anchored protein
MFRRFLLVASLVIAAGAVGSAAPAGAQPYAGCNPAVSDTTPAAGDTITVSGDGALAGGTVTASLDATQIGSGTASGTGAFSFPATIPTTATGTEVLTVDCGGEAGVASVTLTVSAAPTTTTTTAATTTTVAVAADALPRTGSSSTLPMAQIAVGALAVGGLALAGARRRRVIAERFRSI